MADDRVVWITGGGTGLGKGMAVEYARMGLHVAVSGRRRARLDAADEAIEAVGGQGLAVVCDVTEVASVEAAVAEVVAHWGRLDVVLANAGYGVAGRVDALSTEDWRKQFEVNVFGAVTTVRAALPHLHASAGRIGLVGSVAGFLGLPGSSPYSASKAAVATLGGSLSAELASTGISCTTIHPGFVESEIGQTDNDGVFHEDWKDPRPAQLMWSTEKAARVMVRAVESRKREFVFTGHGKLVVFLARHLPGLSALILARSSAKGNAKKLAEALEG